jgi:DNA ligase-4
MSNSDLEHLRERLKPKCIPGGRGNAPACYRTTGDLEETPHYWIRDPRESIVLTLKADVRLVPSCTFATPYSLRFPRVTSIGWDGTKSWADIFSDNDLETLVSQQAGKLSVKFDARGGGGGRGGRGGGRGGGAAGRGAARIRTGIRGVAPGLAVPSMAGVVVQSDIFAGESICVLHTPQAAPPNTREELQKLVTSHGGRVTQEIIASVDSRNCTTRVIAARFDPKNILKQAEAAASNTLDVLTPQWLRDCVAAGQVIPTAPRHRWRFAPGSQLYAEGKVDKFGDRCGVPPCACMHVKASCLTHASLVVSSALQLHGGGERGGCEGAAAAGARRGAGGCADRGAGGRRRQARAQAQGGRQAWPGGAAGC